jgi:hypothetical protein
MRKLTKLEWEILNNLSDSWECPATICPEVASKVPNVSRMDILKVLHSLFIDNLVFIEDIKKIDLGELLSEPEDNFATKFWFGLTARGCEAWENQSVEFSGEPTTWSAVWFVFDSRQEGVGYVEGVSREVCVEGLKRVHPDSWEDKITDKCIEEKPIAGFHAEYYKYIEGGYRIDYKLN